MKKSNAQVRTERIDAAYNLRRLCPRGARVTVKYLRSYRDINGNTRRVVSYFIAYEGQVVCLDHYIALYYQVKQVRSNSLGNGIKVCGDGTEEIAHISFDLYESSEAINTCKEG